MEPSEILTTQDRKDYYLKVIQDVYPDQYSDALISSAIKSLAPELIRTGTLHLIDYPLFEQAVINRDFPFDLSYYIIAHFHNMPSGFRDAVFNVAALLNLDDDAIFEFLADPRYSNWKGMDYSSAWYHKVSPANVERYASLIERSVLTLPLATLLMFYQNDRNLEDYTPHYIDYIEKLMCVTYRMSEDLKQWTINQLSSYLKIDNSYTRVSMLVKKIYSDLFSEEEKQKAYYHFTKHFPSIYEAVQKGSTPTDFFIQVGLDQEETERFYKQYPNYAEQMFHCFRRMNLHVKKEWLPEYLNQRMPLTYLQAIPEYGEGINLYLLHHNLKDVLTPSEKRALKIRITRFLQKEYAVAVDKNTSYTALLSILENTIFNV